MRNVLAPSVSLSAKAVNGSTISTILPNDPAEFITGQLSIKAVATAAIDVFVLPGTKILIFPVGGIITGVWSVLFIGTVAYGTFGRMSFRTQYRARSARVAKGGQTFI